MEVKEILATGTRGKVLGKLFRAIPLRRNGMYVLHSEELARRTGRPLHHKENRVLVSTLDQAAELLEAGRHHIRVFNDEYHQWNLRAPWEVRIVR